MQKPEEININDKDKISVNVGDLLSYHYKYHASVGFDSNYTVDNTDIIDIIDTRIEYYYPERMKDPMITGADKAKGTFVFEAKKPGNAIIMINNEFRFKVESTDTIYVEVK
jgi:hypothetical protein